MPRYPIQQAQAQYHNLPLQLKEALFSVEGAEKIFEIGKKYDFTIEKTGIIAEEIGYVILGFTGPDQLAPSLATALHIDSDKAQDIAREISKQIFLPLRETLKKTHEFDVDSMSPFKSSQPVSGLELPPAFSFGGKKPPTEQHSPFIIDLSRRKPTAPLAPPSPPPLLAPTPPSITKTFPESHPTKPMVSESSDVAAPHDTQQQVNEKDYPRTKTQDTQKALDEPYARPIVIPNPPVMTTSSDSPLLTPRPPDQLIHLRPQKPILPPEPQPQPQTKLRPIDFRKIAIPAASRASPSALPRETPSPIQPPLIPEPAPQKSLSVMPAPIEIPTLASAPQENQTSDPYKDDPYREPIEE